MSALGDIVNRWSANSAIPYFLGAAPEKTLPPFVVFNYVSGTEERCARNTVAWQNAVVNFSVSATTSVDADQAADLARQLYNMQSFGEVADMVLASRQLTYTDTPTLTGSRGWVAQIDFALKH